MLGLDWYCLVWDAISMDVISRLNDSSMYSRRVSEPSEPTYIHVLLTIHTFS